ncbi:phosphohydrolase [Ammoniphilus oxalaticus]|uniref:Phosphohydrolase n=1 Tax=Ammoniphilus oxalaticus TaxID=66863 RepID=A0A419SKQ1_9BACL|nr:MSMEG_1061 family FMN-dependent PPOX-type flavoprotein [Ammoniphilus oxalaticus]RKD24529.1 phosphohydrolase [Ammoniphilus oxalaticus]
MNSINFSQYAVTSEDELRRIVKAPHEHVVKKSVTTINEQCKQFIKMSPLFFLSTSNKDGTCDVSPRGDLPSPIKVINSHQLVIPDRPGNRRLDSITNIISNPHVGLVFLIPGLEEVLRINGRATVIKNGPILNDMQMNGASPLLGIGVDVEECYIHCSRALNQSKIWDAQTWQKAENLPIGKEIFRDHLKMNGIELKA